MPSSLTHYWFARDVVNKNKSVLAFLNVDEFKHITYVGTQGPDVLFFYGRVPWRKRESIKEIQAYGSKLHHEGQGEKFIKLVNYIKQSLLEDKSVLYAYLFGAFLHYCLDSEAHGFIFYRTGFQKENEPLYHYFADHAIYEAYLDTELLHYWHTDPYETKAYRMIMAKKEYMLEVSKMYADQESLATDTFYNGWLDMITIERLLLDRLHLKRALLRLMGLKHSAPYALIHKKHKPKKDHIDYLNLSYEQWANPATNVTSTNSFLDIYELAFAKSEKVVEIMRVLMAGEDPTDSIKALCNGLTYEGIYDNQQMQYFKLVYQKEK